MSSVERAQNALKAIQELEASSFVRRNELGTTLNFSDVESTARATIELFRRIPVEHLNRLPIALLERVLRFSEIVYQRLNSIRSFSPDSTSNPKGERDGLANQFVNEYAENHAALSPVIDYLKSLDSEEQAVSSTLRRAEERIAATLGEADRLLKEASQALEVAKSVSVERGISQQAHYFQKESELHAGLAKSWGKTFALAAFSSSILILVFLFLHKLPFLSPTSPYEAIQLIFGKAAFFAVVAYVLFLCARSYMSHKHNEIVNKHRQNALLTYEAIAVAASPENRDVVISHAAACIFSPQETGYTKGSQTNVSGIVESIPRLIQTNTAIS